MDTRHRLDEVPKGNLWKHDAPLPNFAQLTEAEEADVVIIGGGITGLAAAALLSREGKHVVLLEKKHLSSGATEYTTAMMTQVIDTALADLVSVFGIKQSKLILDSHRRALLLAAELVNGHEKDCEFKICPDYIFASTPGEMDSLEAEFKAAKRLGLPVIWQTAGEELGFKHFGAIEIPDQAKVHPFKLLRLMLDVALSHKLKVFEESPATQIVSGEFGHIVRTPLGEIKAPWVIVATYEPMTRPLRLYFRKGFYTSYVFELAVPASKIREAIYEDNLNPYHYFRIDRNGSEDRLIIGGEDHRSILKRDPDKQFEKLAKYVAKLIPDVNYRIVRKWAGPIVEPAEGLPYIGPLTDKHVLYATGFSGNGTTYAWIAGQIFTDLIQGRRNPWSKLYDASRRPQLKALLVKGRDYTEELFHGLLS